MRRRICQASAQAVWATRGCEAVLAFPLVSRQTDLFAESPGGYVWLIRPEQQKQRTSRQLCGDSLAAELQFSTSSYALTIHSRADPPL